MRPISVLIAALLCVSGVVLVTAADVVPTDIEQPGSQPGELGNLETPDKCDNCHGGYNQAVEPAFNWRGGMMANAGRDPIFWASLAIAEQDFDGSGDLCIRCHSTSGWYADRSTPTDGSALTAKDADGVECDACHQMTNPDNTEHVGVMNSPFIANDEKSPPTAYYGSGMLSLWGGNEKLGPYSITAAPHQFLQSRFHRSVDFCGSCHDVSNPAVGDLAHNNGAQVALDPGSYSGVPGSPVEGKAAFNNFPYQYGVVERTFSEFKSGLLSRTLVSDYASLPGDLRAGAIQAAYQSSMGDYADGTPRYFGCQTCHMRAVTGTGCDRNDAPVRTDLPLHDMTGGNYWMPDAILYQNTQGTLRLGGDLSATQIQAIQAGKSRAQQQLEWAASLVVDGNTLRVTNLTGHKLISGYPEGRRMWLNIKWYGESGNLIREDGRYDELTVQIDGIPTTVESILALEDSNTRIYETHYAMTQEWADQLLGLGYSADLPLSYDRLTGAVGYTLGDLAAQAAGTHHETFHFVLNNYVAKDNRIPPYGFSYDEARKRNTLPVPADQYGDPGPGGAYNYWDEVALNPPSQAAYATVDLLYQPTSWEYIQFLYLANDGSIPFLADEGTNMLEAWLNNGMAEPYVMASAAWGAPPPGCTPPVPVLLSAMPGHQQVTLTWSNEHASDSNVAGYSIYHPQANKAQLVATVGQQTAYIDTGLTNGQEYCYEVASRYAEAMCESGFSNILCVTPNSQGADRIEVQQIETGTSSGSGQDRTFVPADAFSAGDAVVIVARVADVATGLPVSGATVHIEITGPEMHTLASGPSDGDGFAETTWQTQEPGGAGQDGTAPGDYTATIMRVVADGYTWDGVTMSAEFTIEAQEVGRFNLYLPTVRKRTPL